MSTEQIENVEWDGVTEAACEFAYRAGDELKSFKNGEWAPLITLIPGAIKHRAQNPIRFGLTTGGLNFSAPNKDRQPHIQVNGKIRWMEIPPYFIFDESRLSEILDKRNQYFMKVLNLADYARQLGLVVSVESRKFEFSRENFSLNCSWQNGSFIESPDLIR